MTTEVQKIKKDAYDREEPVIVPPVDIYETENEYVIKADMPGVDKGNINITLDDNVLDIEGKINEDTDENKKLKYREYNLNNFSRSFRVGNDIDADKISAQMENGVLTLTLLKREEVKPKKIEIKVE